MRVPRPPRAPHRAGADPEVLLLDVLDTLIHTFVPEHLVKRWKERLRHFVFQAQPPGRGRGQSRGSPVHPPAWARLLPWLGFGGL